jgi:alanyl-tRNA synthetase
MKPDSLMTGNDIRQRFLDYFAARGHRVVKSSPLVPANDATLLFTNAGMVQFKDVFTGLETREYRRATTSQKCVRAGGKHNDLENVGRTRRHHTFFEMLGNFSFGDYFKKDAIRYAWELVTSPELGFGLSKDRLYVTVFREDDEAEGLWQSEAGVSADRIFRMDEKDNFWAMGDTGPCGPCSEIYYDMGAAASEEGHADCKFPCECARYVEIWNLVFMQFERDKSGKMTPLPKPSIDTGMGLERTAAVLQGVISNFDTDLLRPLIDQASEVCGKPYVEDSEAGVSMRILADHARAACFLIHDGVLPANEGRGYVLRKILRRAIRHGRMLGLERPFLYELTGLVANMMRPAYPELMESVTRVARIVKEEETRFGHSLTLALREFEKAVEEAGESKRIPGERVFQLYDTFGLALDLMQEIAAERGVTIDESGFESEMEKQRTRARASWKGGEKGTAAPVFREWLNEGATVFEGYSALESAGCKVLHILGDGMSGESVREVILDHTPFYAESGGQVGDTGVFIRDGEEIARVTNTYAPLKGLTVHKVTLSGELAEGDIVTARVDASCRRSTMRNHTATHLMHAALRRVLGTHVKQAGSIVDPGRLRFDFSHYIALDSSEIEEVERLVNEQILANTELRTDVMDLDSAIETGAMALFGEKYGAKVRVVHVPGFSTELCGGTHVGRTGDIGVFKIVEESSISAGVRRIEAVTGEAAFQNYREAVERIGRMAEMIHAREPELVEAVGKLAQKEHALEKQVEQLRMKLAQSSVAGLLQRVQQVNGVPVLAARVEDLDRGQMRGIVDSLRNKIGSGVIVLGTPGEDDKVALVAAVSKDLNPKLHAGKIVKAVAEKLGGTGGGRPDLAEAGGKNPAQLDATLDQVAGIVAEMLS